MKNPGSVYDSGISAFTDRAAYRTPLGYPRRAYRKENAGKNVKPIILYYLLPHLRANPGLQSSKI